MKIIENSDYSYSEETESGMVDYCNDTGNYMNSEEIRVRLADSPQGVIEAQELLTMALRDETI